MNCVFVTWLSHLTGVKEGHTVFGHSLSIATVAKVFKTAVDFYA